MSDAKSAGTEPNFEYLCRLCASNTKGSKNQPDCVYILDTPSVRTKIETFLQLPISEADSLPKVLCKSCFRQLESASAFVRISTHTQKVFHDILSKLEPAVGGSSIQSSSSPRTTNQIVYRPKRSVDPPAPPNHGCTLEDVDTLDEGIEYQEVEQSENESLHVCFSKSVVHRQNLIESLGCPPSAPRSHRHHSPQPSPRSLGGKAMKRKEKTAAYALELPHYAQQLSTADEKTSHSKDLRLRAQTLMGVLKEDPQTRPAHENPLPRLVLKNPMAKLLVPSPLMAQKNQHRLSKDAKDAYPRTKVLSDLSVGYIIKDTDLLVHMVRAMNGNSKKPSGADLKRLKNTKFVEVIRDPNILKNSELMQVLGCYLARLASITVQEQDEIEEDAKPTVVEECLSRLEITTRFSRNSSKSSPDFYSNEPDGHSLHLSNESVGALHALLRRQQQSVYRLHQNFRKPSQSNVQIRGVDFDRPELQMEPSPKERRSERKKSAYTQFDPPIQQPKKPVLVEASNQTSSRGTSTELSPVNSDVSISFSVIHAPPKPPVEETPPAPPVKRKNSQTSTVATQVPSAVFSVALQVPSNSNLLAVKREETFVPPETWDALAAKDNPETSKKGKDGFQESMNQIRSILRRSLERAESQERNYATIRSGSPKPAKKEVTAVAPPSPKKADTDAQKNKKEQEAINAAMAYPMDETAARRFSIRQRRARSLSTDRGPNGLDTIVETKEDPESKARLSVTPAKTRLNPAPSPPLKSVSYFKSVDVSAPSRHGSNAQRDSGARKRESCAHPPAQRAGKSPRNVSQTSVTQAGRARRRSESDAPATRQVGTETAHYGLSPHAVAMVRQVRNRRASLDLPTPTRRLSFSTAPQKRY